MKTCKRCNTPKLLDEFYKHPRSKDGLDSKCKECAKKASNVNRLTNIDRVREYDRNRPNRIERLAQQKIRNQEEKTKSISRAAKAKYAQNNAHKRKAHYALNNAVRDGRVIPWPICLMPDCNNKPEAHHVHYDLPLDVVWLCDSHHKQVHKETREYFRNYKETT